MTLDAASDSAAPLADGNGTPSGALPEVLTVGEVAAYLRLNPKTIYDAIKRKEFPIARRIGGTIRIYRSALLEWLATGQGPVVSSRSKP
jgi:excisionase family DNA binding protein